MSKITKLTHNKNQLPTEVVTITPELAQEWLTLNLPTNRRLSTYSVDKLVHEMENGYWQVTGDSIKFDTNGDLIDGQHRLRAVVKSGEVIQSLVVWDVPTTAFKAIDRNQVRTNSQVLGIKGEKNTAALASALRLLYCYRCGDLTPNNLSNSIVGPSDLEELLHNEGGIRESIRVGNRAKNLLSPGVAGFAHYLCAEMDIDMANEFFDRLVTGEMLKKTDPLYKLREKLMSMNMVKQGKDARTTSLEKAGMIINAWNLHRSKSKKKTFAYDPAVDEFPEVL